jgi:hypothetical protein
VLQFELHHCRDVMDRFRELRRGISRIASVAMSFIRGTSIQH